MPRMTKFHKKEQDMQELPNKISQHLDKTGRVKVIPDDPNDKDIAMQQQKIMNHLINSDDFKKMQYDLEEQYRNVPIDVDLSFYCTCAHCGNNQGILRNIGHPPVQIVICNECWGK